MPTECDLTGWHVPSRVHVVHETQHARLTLELIGAQATKSECISKLEPLSRGINPLHHEHNLSRRPVYMPSPTVHEIHVIPIHFALISGADPEYRQSACEETRMTIVLLLSEAGIKQQAQ